jgi:truncated hemoglobin YjbI
MIAGVNEELITAIIKEFYQVAESDPIIGHFFFGKDLEHITLQQTKFAIGLLGGQGAYKGKSMDEAHRSLQIRPAHFDRRQVLLKQLMLKHGLPEAPCREWLRREHRLRGLIVGSEQESRTCRD